MTTLAADHIDMLRKSVRGRVLLPADAGYDVARTVWNASASFDLMTLPGRPLSRGPSQVFVFVNVDNVGDVAVRDSLAFPQPGRAVSAGFEARW